MDATLKTHPFNRLLQNPFFRSGGLIAVAVLLVTLAFPGLISGLFRADQFMPHATCYLRNPAIIRLHVSGDMVIGLSYVAISSMLAHLVYKASRSIPFHWMFLAFGLFIITCGFTHFMEVWTVWTPVYWLAGYIKVVCAAASAVTALALYRLLPKVFSLINSVRVSEERRTKLESANRELESFADTVSHDLRAPLRTVRGMAAALQEDHGPQLDESARAYMDRITHAAERMDRLIQDLLEYSRISRVDFELQAVGLLAVVESAKRSLASDLLSSQGEILVQRDLPFVLANDMLLTQALVNLLSNALKFVATGVKPRIEVSTREVGGRVQLFIKDNGIGIPAEYRQKIFRIFERLHSASEYPGTGIGLAIVEKAVTRMGGSLGFESTTAQGSTFWIELRKAQQPAAAAVIAA